MQIAMIAPVRVDFMGTVVSTAGWFRVSYINYREIDAGKLSANCRMAVFRCKKGFICVI